ncbi:MAG TPA: ATP phosphoribosyltransferase regulatory subunit [Methylomirabilota bacterium]|jgi:ATP phosphoribosyltransferase regulatory subunit|nr:ATP phosphoribosyltransferase regulatory subunit [Methylomirabilota bacterium]
MDRRSLHSQLPTGVKIYLPDEAARLRGLQERLLGVFRLWGFREVVTPTYEFFDVLALGTDESLQERMFRFVDRETGRMLALRADVTPQIARIAATRLRDQPKPYRLAYRTNLFRYDEPRVGRQREFYQAGVELIGLDKPEADAEMIAMAIEGFRAAGLSRFQIDVGQVEFVRGILEGLGVERLVARALRDALRRKDRAELERLVGELRVPPATADLLLALPTLHGRAGVLPRAAALVQNPRSERAVASLSEVHRLLTAYGLGDAVILDLGEVRGFDYYSGVNFEGYVEGFGAEVCGGGRYDHLLARFGDPCPATGFAFDVNRLLLALEAQGVELPVRGPEVFIIDFTEDKATALVLSRRLRDLGLAVARDIMSRPLHESLAYAREIRATRVLVIDPDGLGRGEVRIVDPTSGQDEPVPLGELLAAPARLLEPAGGLVSEADH